MSTTWGFRSRALWTSGRPRQALARAPETDRLRARGWLEPKAGVGVLRIRCIRHPECSPTNQSRETTTRR